MSEKDPVGDRALGVGGAVDSAVGVDPASESKELLWRLTTAMPRRKGAGMEAGGGISPVSCFHR